MRASALQNALKRSLQTRERFVEHPPEGSEPSGGLASCLDTDSEVCYNGRQKQRLVAASHGVATKERGRGRLEAEMGRKNRGDSRKQARWSEGGE